MSPPTRPPADPLQQLRALFPELVTEGPDGAVLNVDVLKTLVGDRTVADADERFGLHWHGKRRARQLALTPGTGTLRPRPEDGVDWDGTRNLLIQGDNLEVLKLLHKSYAGRVKLIYIDPPYNTGRDFVYPDSFQHSLKHYLEMTGQVQGGRRMASHTETGGRFHTDWLNMLYPRLWLARSLLREDGVLMLSIDDTELAHARMLLAELFGDEGLIGTLVHQRAKGGGQARHIVKGHDYILVAARNIERCAPLRRDKVVQGRTETIDGREVLIDDDVVRKRFGKYDKASGDRRCFYEELLECKGEARKRAIDAGIARGDYFLQPWPNGLHAICRRVPLDEASSKLYSIIRVLSEEGKKDLEALGLDDVFSYPKPVALMTQLIRAATSGDDIVMDFFAGSGSTGHAAWAQNLADGGTRRFILVQLPEPLSAADKQQAVGAALCARLGRPPHIAELTRERLLRAGAALRAQHPATTADLGFRVMALDTSNLRPWPSAPDTPADLEQALREQANPLLEGRTEADLHAELLLQRGLDLCAPLRRQVIAGKPVCALGDGELFTCLVSHIAADEVEPLALGILAWQQALAPAGSSGCVLLDSAFADDLAKGRLIALLEHRGRMQVQSI